MVLSRAASILALIAIVCASLYEDGIEGGKKVGAHVLAPPRVFRAVTDQPTSRQEETTESRVKKSLKENPDPNYSQKWEEQVRSSLAPIAREKRSPKTYYYSKSSKAASCGCKHTVSGSRGSQSSGSRGWGYGSSENGGQGGGGGGGWGRGRGEGSGGGFHVSGITTVFAQAGCVC